MLKTLLYYLIALTTAARFVDMAYLLTNNRTNLPMSVIIVTSAMILLGAAIVAKKFLGGIRHRHIMMFFLVQAGMVVFNIINVAIFYPLPISAAETLVVGSFLDILIAFSSIFACIRESRSSYKPFVRVVSGGAADSRKRA